MKKIILSTLLSLSLSQAALARPACNAENKGITYCETYSSGKSYLLQCQWVEYGKYFTWVAAGNYPCSPEELSNTEQVEITPEQD